MKSSESELISQLESVLRSNPEVLNERDRNGTGLALLHYAAKRRSVEFIKILVETNGGIESAKTADHNGYLPIHWACFFCNVEAVKYLLSINPESINIANPDGLYPLHCALCHTSETNDRKDLVRFLLLRDPSALL
jgi:ankyrin repeat protein